RRSPRRRARRTQAARKERPPLQRLQAAPLGRKTQTTSVDVPPPFPRPGPSHTQSPSQGRRPAFATPPRRSGGPGACGGGVAGNSGTRQADWLKLRTVTLLLEHLNREPREGKGLGTWRRRSRRRTTPTSTTRKTRRKKRLRTMTRWCVVATARRNTCRCCAARARSPARLDAGSARRRRRRRREGRRTQEEEEPPVAEARLAMQREAAGRGADGEERPPAEVKQEDPDYGDEELEELGGLARQVAVKASEAYTRGTLASAGVVKRDPRPGFLTPVVLRKTVAYLCLQNYKSAALYGSAALGRHKKHYEAWATANGLSATQAVGPLALWERLLVTGVWHLLRADELASLRVGFVTVEGRPTAALRVAKSKTDQAGHGTVVARACVCSGDRLPRCPACCLKEQWEARVGQLARARSVGSQEARLFLGAPIIRAAEAAHHMAKATAGPASAAAVEVDMVPPPQDRQAVAFGAEEMLVQHGITGILHKPAAVSGPAHTWSTR
ncbi:unnamed protein product, partial [Symbiodinium microadriaticum]